MSGLGRSRGLGSVVPAAVMDEGRAGAGWRGGTAPAGLLLLLPDRGLEWRRPRRGCGCDCGCCAKVEAGMEVAVVEMARRCRLLDDWPLESRDMGDDDTAAASSGNGSQKAGDGRGYVSPCCPGVARPTMPRGWS